ncbi:MAG: flagellar hook-associated protein FlgL [Pseudobdellovibrionaceae bacterium]
MRIADKMATGQVNNSLGQKRAEMVQLQNQAATQKRVTKPSDDPLAATRVLSARTDGRGVDQFLKNLNIARSFLEFTDQSLGELTESMMRAKELAIAQSTDGGASEETRRVAATEISQIFNQSVQIGNRKLGDRYIFGGHKTLNAPFSARGEYRGDDGDIKIQIDKDSFVPMNIPGEKIFLGVGVDADGIIRESQGTPKNVEDLQKAKIDETERRERRQEIEEQNLPSGMRGLASVSDENAPVSGREESKAVNVFKVLQNLEVGLRVNDKDQIHASLDELDNAISQVVLARSQVGSRVTALDMATESLQKARVDNKVTASQMEDADLFEVVSDINKTEGAMKATMETSAKLIQPSLLDFLR